MRILIVEDEREIANLVKTSLEDECFIVDIADNGDEGLELAKSVSYDLIVLDNILPRKTGKQICEELRKSGYAIPIIVLSVKSEPTAKVELLNAGADDYLQKPFSLQELLARVRALLRRPKQVQSEIMKMGNLTLDIKRHLAFRNEKEIPLTRKEFILLEYLMRNSENVVSRGMILEHVWDMHADPFSNTIESHIRSLRKKVDSRQRKKLIHTISGRGYKISLK